MYYWVLTTHAIIKWLVLSTLTISIVQSLHGYYTNKTFSRIHNAFRHWTATVAHIQLVVGILLYTKSPTAQHYWSAVDESSYSSDGFFFGVLHILLMLLAILIITIGSAKAKRKKRDKDKFRTLLLWFTMGLLLILIAIPWPFSPLANRPYIRTF